MQSSIVSTYVPLGGWRNGSACDSSPQVWGFDSLTPQDTFVLLILSEMTSVDQSEFFFETFG